MYIVVPNLCVYNGMNDAEITEFRTLCFIAEAVPKKILELMNVPGLSRENVASHLQVGQL